MDKINIKFNNPIMDQENIEKIAGKVNDVIDNGPDLIEGKDIAPDDISATGKITGDEIVENMTGYEFAKGDETTNLTREFVYAGVVKNGNKITFVIACNITKTGNISVSPTLGSFYIPAELYNKIYPSRIGAYDYVAVATLKAWVSDNSSKDIQIYIVKNTNNRLTTSLNTSPLNALDTNAKYYVRYELTLLLSDNLVGE